MILTAEQKTAVAAICSAIDANRADKFLLYGVTGSGKTEVYLQAIAHLLKKGQSALVLAPEIGMTSQLVQRFEERFADHIALLHSGLTDKERRNTWRRVASGEARIVIGTRLALFAPIQSLGLIVIDEEYETTYKSEQNPRYHARELACQFGVPVVMGSATPSIETYYGAEQGEINKLVLPKRIDDRPLPPVEVVDLREEKEFLLSGKLRRELKETIERGEQAILFINRRGYFTFITCQNCGLTIECPRCAVSLTYHTSDRQLRCALCDYSTVAPPRCPRCQSGTLKYLGSGTQRIENEVREIVPTARILRFDRDVKKPELIFSAFAEGQADILIGTQLVTKGLDVAKVTLVGVVNADTALHFPDFRAAEHTFQLLTQVAGRAGRHHLPGKVIIQTYNPEHYAIQAAAKHDYESFYKKEIEFRRELNYPPFTKLIAITVSSKEKDKAKEQAEGMGNKLKGNFQVLGPISAVIPKARSEWRYSILLKGGNMAEMHQAVEQAVNSIKLPPKIKLTIDVEPMN